MIHFNITYAQVSKKEKKKLFPQRFMNKIV